LPAGPPGWRDQLTLLAGAVVWLLVVLALATHSAGDPGFSTSGSGGRCRTRPASVGAWVSDVAFFLVGYSVWWAVLVGARAWLGGLARVLRAHSGAPAVGRDAGVASLARPGGPARRERLARMDPPYQWEAQVAGGNAGGVLGYSLGKWSQSLLGFAGSGVLWIAVLVAGVSLGSASRGWARPSGSAAASSRCARAAPSASSGRGRAPRRGGDARARGDRRGRARAAGAAPADRDRADAGRRAQEHPRRQGTAKAPLQRARRHQAAAGRPARLGAAAPGER
jgi:hypothetical protein